jgi:transketolase
MKEKKRGFTLEKLDVEGLKKEATEIRKEIIKMLAEAGSGHPGGSLSSADIMTALFFNVMKHNPHDPKWEGRDRFLLSKGHSAPVLYAAFARAGYFPIEELKTLRKIGTRLQGHPSAADLPILESSSGSLGLGLSICAGIAIAGKMDKKDYKVYCLMGDGEQQEGAVWEAAMSASHFKLDNLCAIVDMNGMQIDGATSEVMNIEPLAQKYESFGWNFIEIDGNSMKQVLKAFEKFDSNRGKEKPTVILAKTVKGKGVSFMEGKAEWHGKAPSAKEAEEALKELSDIK